MSNIESTSARTKRESVELVPRFSNRSYTDETLLERRTWLERQTNSDLSMIGTTSIPAQTMRGKVENPIGAVQTPLGIAGPLKVSGEHAEGEFYVPLATTEGALVKSFERGAIAITRSGGAQVRIANDSNCCSPIFTLPDVGVAARFIKMVQSNFTKLASIAAGTTTHGQLLSTDCHLIGRDVVIDMRFFTADAHGMNMAVKATEAICQWLKTQAPIEHHLTLSGASSEKRASGAALRIGKGKHVTAEATLSATIVRRYLYSSPIGICRMWHRSLLGQLQSGTIGYNGHVANGLAAIFIACGQDVANITNGSVAITSLETNGVGDLVASVTLPSLNVATVGGGTGIGTSKECLALLDCFGSGKARKFAEIVAATVLAGELSFGASLAFGDFAKAHEKYGRNRPDLSGPE